MAVRLQAISTDYILGAVNWKAPVDLASTVNITLASLVTGFVVDGIAAAAGYRVLLKDQTTASQNGVYLVSAGAPVRDVDFDDDVGANSFKTTVMRGTANSTKTFTCSSAIGADIIGTSNLTFLEDGFTGILPVSRGGTGVATLDAGNVLVGNGTGNVLTTKPAPTGDFVGTTDVQTLTNKTLVGAQPISNGTQSIILSPGGTGATSTTLLGQQTSNISVTLPAASGTLALVTDISAAQNGLSVKAPVLAATSGTTLTNANYPTITGTPTYNSVGGSGSNGIFTGTLVTSGVLTIDGVNILTGNRVLVKDQTAGAQNGIYVATVTGTAFTLDRATDFNTNAKVVDGSYVWVDQGTTNLDTSFVLTTNDPITVGTTIIVFQRFSRVEQIIAGNGITRTNTTLTTNLLANGGIVFSGGAMQVDLSASAIAGVLSVADGGTGASAFNAGNVLVGAGAATPIANKAAPTGSFVGTSDVQTLTNKTLTNPVINAVATATGFPIVAFTGAGESGFSLNSTLTGGTPTIAAVGATSNIDLNLMPKNSGIINIVGGKINLINPSATGAVQLVVSNTAFTSWTFTLPTTTGTNGQILSTNGSGITSWVSASSIAGLKIFNGTLNSQQADAISTTFTSVGYYVWNNTELGASTARTFSYEAQQVGVGGTNRTLQVRLFDLTNSVALYTSAAISAAGVVSAAFTAPTTSARIALQVLKNAIGGVNPTVYGGSVSITV